MHLPHFLTTIFLVGGLLRAASAAAEPGKHFSSAPRIECDISLRTWCMVGVDGTVRLDGDSYRRTWTLQDRAEMKDGPLVIVEDGRNCSSAGSLTVKKLPEHVEGSTLVIPYALTSKEDCQLQFKAPMRENSIDPSYRQFILNGVLVGGVQLYNYE